MFRLGRAVLLSVALLFIIGCGAHAQTIPACVAKELMNAPKGTSIEPYVYNGKKVFVVSPGPHCNDCMTKVVNEACQPVCELGGLAAKGDGKCADFDKNAKRDIYVGKEQ